MSRAIVITSGKGGVGKSTLCVTLGRALASRGKRVVLIDADFGLNNLDVMMRLENRVVYDVVDVVENRCRISQALIVDVVEKNLSIMPSAHSYDKSVLNAQSLRAIVMALKQRFDFVFIDSPAGIEYGFHRAVAAADEALIVTTPHLSAIRDAEKVIALIKPYSLKGEAVVLNRVRGDMEKNGEAVTTAEVEEYLATRVLGAIPDADGINALSTISASLKAKTEGYVAVNMLCSYLINGYGEVYDASKRYRGFFGALKRKIRKII